MARLEMCLCVYVRAGVGKKGNQLGVVHMKTHILKASPKEMGDSLMSVEDFE
jgi:hypothetical protein